MAAHQIPREKFVQGHGTYSNLLPWESRVTPEAFEIVPVPLNWVGPTAIVIFIVVMFSLLAYGMAREGDVLLAILIITGGLLTAAFGSALTFKNQQELQQRGPVFHYDRRSGKISLPDRQLTFDSGSHLSFDFIISPYYSPEGRREELVAELQLVVEKEGQTERYVIVQALTRYELKPMVAEVHRYVKLPTREIEHAGFLTPKVYEKMFGQD